LSLVCAVMYGAMLELRATLKGVWRVGGWAGGRVGGWAGGWVLSSCREWADRWMGGW
jgi:hypothetical protein